MTTESLTDTRWKSVTLDKVYEFRSGLSKPASEFGSGYPFLTFKDVFYNYFAPDPLGDLVQSTDRERATCDIQRGDVFLTRTSETMNDLGMSCVALKDYPEATFNGFTKRLRPLDQSAIDPAYAGYYFRSRDFRVAITAMSTLSTRASLNNEMLARLTISLPDIKTQQAIGSVLLAFDDKIELNRRMNRTLEQMAAAIFKAWFVEFEPVRAKASGAASFPGMPQPVFDALPATFANSELGPIPEGWEVKAIGDAVEIKGGGTPSTKNPEFWNGPHHWVTPKDLSSLTDPILLDTARRLTDSGVAKVGSGLLPKETVLLSSRAPIGYLAITAIKTAINQGFIAMLPGGRLPPTYLLNWASFYMDDIKSNANGTTFQEISKKNFRPLRAVVPSPVVTAGFHEVVGPLYDQIRLNMKESKTLAETRDALLPKLLSGEVRVAQQNPAEAVA